MQTEPHVVRASPTPASADLVLPRVVGESDVRRVRHAVRDLSCDDAKAPRFPGPNPVSLDTSHFPGLRGKAYYVCEKTDGVRFLMTVATLPTPSGPLKLVALLDRALTAYVLPLRHVPKALFQGSLFDGELAWNKAESRWDFLVFDTPCVSGIPVLNLPLRARLEAARRGLDAYRPDPSDPVRLRLKTFVPCGRHEAIDRHLALASAAYDVDGVILTPAADAVVYGRHVGMFKLKTGAHHTVDFLVGHDGRQLAVFDAGRHVAVGTARVTCQPGSIVECRAAEGHQGVWDPVGTRTDKTTANDMFTYKKTLLNMREGLTLDHVKRVFA